MSTNPYAPPNAVVADIPHPDTSPASPPFFPVSLLKLGVMSLCTMGFYELYWFYKNWQFIRAREKSDISPFWRALFAYFFCYSCFARIKNHGQSIGLSPALSAGLLAIAWIGVTITWKLPDPYALITFVAGFFLLPVQAHVNAINEMTAPGHNRNSRFSGWNWVGIVVGGLCLALVVIGTFVEE